MHELAARLARGEEAAFTELYDSCADRLHRYLSLRLQSRDAAADVLQDTFLRAVRSRRRFRSVENPTAYMFQIARNEAARAAKRCRKTEPVLSSNTLFDVAHVVEATDDVAEIAAAALSRLTPDDREIVELKIFAGLTFREVAEVLHLPPGTVATRYRRALQSLRSWLTKQTR
jgi:RNA polymerase sigma-70 factor (ECF subfamily)